MSNLPRHHIESRRRDRGLMVVFGVIAALLVACVVGSAFVAAAEKVTAAITGSLTRTIRTERR
ncbi:hypothetical protein U5817_09855 [Aromatoleum evansii]|uniref:Uncharacterized protein n=1 Tax=Aromatoleum evansii TaxID=59406 RepID=A0ABZ1AR48_AROEV|nr:hypothetical protein U5817_09505 [Aromatoleum evansii]WRL48330.1 hypothetical protein U5817_09855 [Aromatoleum evansii]